MTNPERSICEELVEFQHGRRRQSYQSHMRLTGSLQKSLDCSCHTCTLIQECHYLYKDQEQTPILVLPDGSEWLYSLDGLCNVLDSAISLILHFWINC